jgi:serralysin
MLYDIQAMQYLYGANTGYNTGDNTYTFDPALPFIKTLWDAGGKDTISVSNFTLGCTIDLRPGSFSKVSYFDDISAPVTWTTAPPTPTYDGTDDLAIAYGCVIENAIGGSGNDTLTGNDVNNSLDGGAGNDSIDGGAGTDTAVYSMARASVALTKTSTGFTLTDNSKVAGTDTLQAMERIKFSDAGIALDVASTQAAGQTVMLLGAVLPGRLVFDSSKQALLGAAIDLFDQGYSLQTLSGAVMRLPIWDVLTQKSAPTNTDIATYLLNNVNGAAPDATTLANAVKSLNTETDFATQGNFLWHLAESAVNQTRIDLVGLAATGLVYTV